MGKRKRKLTAAEKAEKKQRQKEYMTIFINGKQKRVKRPPTTVIIKCKTRNLEVDPSPGIKLAT
jgi:hypothetical protein